MTKCKALIIRVLDLFICVTLLIVLSPMLVFISILQLFLGEGEIFYKQIRVGRDGNEFYLLKFATMLKDSPNIGAGDITVKSDPRVLKHGKLLRKTKINELPQLINILSGEMSFVGPRPLTVKNFSFYSIDEKKYIINMKPGLTGIGSLFFRDEEKFLYGNENPEQFYQTSIVPYKALLERYYFQNQSVSLYLRIFVLTILSVMFPQLRLNKYFKDIPTPPPELDI